jgi:hypothetical protein
MPRMGLSTTLTSWAPRALSVLRVAAGSLYIEHGMQSYLISPPLGTAPSHCFRTLASPGRWNLSVVFS